MKARGLQDKAWEDRKKWILSSEKRRSCTATEINLPEHTYSQAKQCIIQLKKFAFIASNSELLQSFSTSENIIQKVFVRRKSEMRKTLDDCKKN